MIFAGIRPVHNVLLFLARGPFCAKPLNKVPGARLLTSILGCNGKKLCARRGPSLTEVDLLLGAQ